jgi:hypothetical protein
MKKLILVASICLATALSAPAGVYSYTYNSGFDISGSIPDGETSPSSDTRTISGIADTAITSLTAQLDVSGGLNGDW